MTTPLNTTPVNENPELANLKEREKTLVEKLARHDKADANAYQRTGFDINEIKNRTKMQLEEVRKAIADLSK